MAFSSPRFTRLYRRWLTEQEAALTSIPTQISEAFAAGRAALECTVLPHDYEHLSPLGRRRQSRRRRDTADAEPRAKTAHGVNRSLNGVVNGVVHS
jgi:hypothetical protein